MTPMQQNPVTSDSQATTSKLMAPSKLKLFAYLWYLGVRESLQVQRFIVLLALDDEGVLWKQVLECCKLHGVIFLGSLGGWRCGVQPLLRWTLQATGNLGGHAAFAMQTTTAFDYLFQAFWVVPAYLITLLVSCSLYNDMAQRAVQVRNKHNSRLKMEQQQQQSQPSPADMNTSVSKGMSSNGTATQNRNHAAATSPYEGAAQELYRVALFLVLYVEISLVGLLPLIGRSLYLLLSCWLYAYYCYEYQWALRGMRVQDRLALFEGYAPFFAGYGLILASVTVLLPFYLGSALMSLLFPVFVLVACDSHVTHAIQEAVVGGDINTARTAQQERHVSQSAAVEGKELACNVDFKVPVFSFAAWPTSMLLGALFKNTK